MTHPDDFWHQFPNSRQENVLDRILDRCLSLHLKKQFLIALSPHRAGGQLVSALSGSGPERTNVGRCGREAGGHMRLPDLIRRLLEETGIERLRLSSVEPMDFSDDLLGLMASSPRIARHVHAPPQTGSEPRF